MTDEEAIATILHMDQVYRDLWDSRDADGHIRDLTDVENRFCRDMREIRDLHANFEGGAHKLYGDSEHYRMICECSRKLRVKSLRETHEIFRRDQP